jgi:hypothetical protein
VLAAAVTIASYATGYACYAMSWPTSTRRLRTLRRVALLLALASLARISPAPADEGPITFVMPADTPTVDAADNLWLARFPGTAPYPVVAEGVEVDEVDEGDELEPASLDDSRIAANRSSSQQVGDWNPVVVGYDRGFVIGSRKNEELEDEECVYKLRINGWGQLRDTVFDSKGSNRDINQIQLKRARLVFSGHAFSQDFNYYLQIDGRSSASDSLRILDYYMFYDLGHHAWNLERGTFGVMAGLYKMPFSRARQMSGRELEFSDRSMASIYFDINRSLAWGLYGRADAFARPLHWEAAVFNGFVTGGADTGSSGTLDNNYAVSGRVHCFPMGDWGADGMADLENHQTLATRCGLGMAFTTINRLGSTEFNSLRVVDSGAQLSSLLASGIDQYDVAQYAANGSLKYRGISLNLEYYLRNVSGFRGGALPDLFDHGFWLQAGYFVIPQKLELLARWSRVQGNSGTLGLSQQSSAEIAGGGVVYFREQHAKFTMDITHLDGASINSNALDISPGDIGWLYRGQLQFSF